MWAYNATLKCAFNGRYHVLSSVCQRSPFISKTTFCTAPLQKTVLSPKRQSVVTAVFRACFQQKVLKKDLYTSRWMQSAVDTSVAKDVIIFLYDNAKLHKAITLFGIVNYLMFMSVAANCYSVLTEQPKGEGKGSSEFDSNSNEGSSFSPLYSEASNSSSSSLGVAEGSDKSNKISSDLVLKGLCGATFLLGVLVLSGTWLYCNHSVRMVVLNKGGKRVTVVTHGIFGKNRFHSMDVEKVSCRGNRAISSAVLLKVKGKFFSYILDRKGKYTNPQLFDATVGIVRDLK